MSVLKIKDQNGNWIQIPTIKGEDGQDYVLTENDKQEIAGLVDAPVEDVQVNNTSIVTNGVANIPLANSNTYGVVKIGQGLRIDSNNLVMNKATDAQVQAGVTGYRPITPVNQHQSVFYGLAKASGDTTQSASDNTVGTYTDGAKTAIQTMLGVPSIDDVVTDVQIDGTSIVSNGVAEIPRASTTNAGVFVVGTGLTVSPSTNRVTLNPAWESLIKTGTEGYLAITPKHQHESTFYGLAKAAGDATQSSSSNTVGTYTDEAIVAIQKMLGIYKAPWELINEETFTFETESNYVITTDSNGSPFELTDIIVCFETPKQDIDSAMGQYGQIWIYNSSNTKFLPECGAWTQAANSSAHGCRAIIEQDGGLMTIQTVRSTTSSNTGMMGYRYESGFKTTGNGFIYTDNTTYSFVKVEIPAVTGTGHYIIYGRRKT